MSIQLPSRIQIKLQKRMKYSRKSIMRRGNSWVITARKMFLKRSLLKNIRKKVLQILIRFDLFSTKGKL